MITDNYKTEKAIQANLARWTKLTNDPSGPTNRDMATAALKRLYRNVLKKEPALIVFCDSPYQIATVPVLVTNIVRSTCWAALCRRMDRYGGDDPSFENAWKNEWKQLLQADEICEMFAAILYREDFYSIGKSTLRTCVSVTEKTLKDGLRLGVLREGEMSFARDQKKPARGRLFAAPFELEFFKQQMRIFQYVEATAGLDVELLNAHTIMALATRSFDPRWLTKLWPATKDLIGKRQHPEVTEACQKIKQQSAAVANSCTRMLTWFFRLPAREPQPTPDFVDDLVSQRGRRQDGRPEPFTNADWPLVWTAFSRVLAEGIETYQRQKNSRAAPLAYTMWMPYAVSWLPFAICCKLAFPQIFQDSPELDDSLDCLALLCYAALGYSFTRELAFVCSKPLSFHVNQNNQLHNEYGPAISFQDGYNFYAWRGVPVREELLFQRQSISVEQILSNKNAELRRVMIELYGESRYLEDAGAKLIHKDDCGELYMLELRGDEPLCMVKVLNSTAEPDGSFKSYFLRVPPNMTTAKQAVAWTFNLTPDQYDPQFQS